MKPLKISCPNCRLRRHPHRRIANCAGTIRGEFVDFGLLCGRVRNGDRENAEACGAERSKRAPAERPRKAFSQGQMSQLLRPEPIAYAPASRVNSSGLVLDSDIGDEQGF